MAKAVALSCHIKVTLAIDDLIRRRAIDMPDHTTLSAHYPRFIFGQAMNDH